ncbi:MAG: hypothetical protein RBG13Loki_3942 [Promethearchaeota archaeon CR_4]|nr:MAG: hypothetical protein RBG13Loki_3942 [Candidatus Lokiarchaeota archaeon CR_4]
MAKQSPKKWGGIRHFYSLLIKNLKIFIRNHGLVVISFLSPIILMGIFVVTFSAQNAGGTMNGGVAYNIAFLNVDKEGLNSTDPGGLVSHHFIAVTKNISLFQVYDNSNKYEGRPITETYGNTLLSEGKLDVLVTLPANFSEVAIGSTWWYQVLKMRNFENISEILNGTGVDIEFAKNLTAAVNGTNFPTGFQPNFTIGLTPNPIDGALITSTLVGIVDQLLLSYNALNMTTIEVFIRNGIDQPLSFFDYFMAKYIIIAGLMPISAVATIIVNEREEGSFSLVDRTLASRGVNLLSLTISQLIISGIQIFILTGLLWISGAYIHPNFNWLLLLLICSTLAFVSISIGLLLGLTTKNAATSGTIAFLILIIFQLMGGTFANINPDVSRWIPMFYCTQAALFTIIEGASWEIVGLYLIPPLLMGLTIYLLANLAFKLKKRL